MSGRLEDMTLAELGELFPIVLAPHNPQWESLAAEEIDLLRELLAPVTHGTEVISHIGSTAIPGIYAKPIIDILVEVRPDIGFEDVRKVLVSADYICMNRTQTRMSFNKGYTPKGYADRVYHIHVHRTGDNAEIYFRDYLRAHSDVAKDYETLKLSLATTYRHNRDAYTEAKTDFVTRFSKRQV